MADHSWGITYFEKAYIHAEHLSKYFYFHDM